MGLDALANPDLRVQLIGRFQLFAGSSTTPLRLPAGKATTVARLLAVRRGAFVPTDTVVDVLWGDDPPPGAAQNVASLVSRLRRVFGAERISGGRTGYRFEGSGCVVDVDAAERLVGEAETQLRARRPSLGASAAAHARQLLERGTFLEDEPFAPWAEEGRRQAERLLRRARQAGWEAALAVGDVQGALDVTARAIEANPLDEEASRARMQALYVAGDAATALAAYEELRAALADELGIGPSEPTEQLYLAILRSEPLPRSGTAPREATPGQAQLVGRERELHGLAERWSAAAGGQPGVVVVAGGAGAGKTRLCTELIRQARATGAVVLSSVCHAAERSLFVQPVLEALRAFLAAIPPERAQALAGEWSGTLVDLMPELRVMLAVHGYERATPELEHRRALEAVSELVRRIAREQPVLLVLDDLHHAGESTLQLVHFLLDRLGTERVLILGAATPDAVDRLRTVLDPRLEVLVLEPLSLAAVEQLAARLGIGDVSATAVHRQTGGHAQFVVELLRLPHVGDGTSAPPSLQLTVLERVRRAGRDVEELLRVAAVVGLAFDLDLVAELANLNPEEAAERAERALTAGLLTADGSRFEFSGSVIRETLYEATPPPIRASRHRRAAARLADRPEAAASHHAGAGDWAEARDAWAAAAERAIRAFAIRDAERVLTEAVAAAERAGDQRALARTRLRRGQLREELADYEAAQDDHVAALTIARAVADEELEAQALERLGWTAYYGRDSATASDLAARAAELAESAAAAPGALPSALVLVGRTRHWAGDIDGAAEAYEEALSRNPDPRTTASALSCLGALLEHGDRFAEARRTLDQAAAESTRTGAFRPLLRTLFFAGLARGNLGDFGGALRALERKRRLLDEYDVHFYRARTDTLLSWIWREVGDPGRARGLAEQAIAEAREVDAGSLQVEQELHGLLGAAECALLDGDEATAGGLVDEAEPLLSGWLPFHWRAELRFRELRCRLEPKEAEELLDLARQWGSRKYEALALGHLDRRAEAAAVAAATGSDLLVAEVAPAGEAKVAFDRLATALPVELRDGFVTRGRLARLVAARARTGAGL